MSSIALPALSFISPAFSSTVSAALLALSDMLESLDDDGAASEDGAGVVSPEGAGAGVLSGAAGWVASAAPLPAALVSSLLEQAASKLSDAAMARTAKYLRVFCMESLSS
jgi:hypothetical protein